MFLREKDVGLLALHQVQCVWSSGFSVASCFICAFVESTITENQLFQDLLNGTLGVELDGNSLSAAAVSVRQSYYPAIL